MGLDAEAVEDLGVGFVVALNRDDSDFESFRHVASARTMNRCSR